MHINFQAAFIYAGYSGLHRHAYSNGTPVGIGNSRAFAGKQHHAIGPIKAFDFNFNLLADDWIALGEREDRKNALFYTAGQINENILVMDAKDFAQFHLG